MFPTFPKSKTSHHALLSKMKICKMIQVLSHITKENLMKLKKMIIMLFFLSMKSKLKNLVLILHNQLYTSELKAL